MNVREEQLAFYQWVGRAITQWAAVEIALADVVRSCFCDADASASAVAFYSVENFRSKLRIADNLVSARFGDNSLFTSDWRKLHERAKSAAKGRNTIAHHWLLIEPKNRSGKMLNRWSRL